MSVKNSEDDIITIRSPGEVESPRKKMRLDNSSRKGWSLMDRRTDQEVLQEMGVSLLEPDDGENVYDSNTTHKPQKRKCNQENVNPNVNSSPNKSPSKSPKSKQSPSPGPSRVRSPRSADKSKPLQPTENLLETTLISNYQIDEETPLGQSVSATCMPVAQCNSAKKRKGCFTPLGIEEEAILSRRLQSSPTGTDSFSSLSDEMLLSVFRWLPKRSLAHCMLVCKRWHRVACDETLWQRLDLGNKTIAKDALGKILSRKPIIVRLATSEIGQWHTTCLPPPSRIQYLDLSVAAIDRETLNNLLLCCPILKKLSLEGLELDDSTCSIIGKCSNLETLNLMMAQGITSQGLTSILEGCPNIHSLNISWCDLSEESLNILVNKLPTALQRLNIAGARILTDDMLSELVTRCPFLLELDLSDCSRVGATGVSHVQTLRRLEHLALSRCYFLPPHVLTKLNCMPSLQYLEVWGMLQTNSLNALRAALPAIQINQFMFSAIARPTVGTRRTSIWGLRTRD